MQEAIFTSRAFTSCGALRIAAEMAKFQIVIRPTDIAKWSIQVDSRRAVRQTRRSQHVPVCGLSYKQRTKKVTNANAMMANWKKDVALEDDKIHQGIRRKPYGLWRWRIIGRTKIRRCTVLFI